MDECAIGKGVTAAAAAAVEKEGAVAACRRYRSSSNMASAMAAAEGNTACTGGRGWKPVVKAGATDACAVTGSGCVVAEAVYGSIEEEIEVSV